jgi:hypothetical protein
VARGFPGRRLLRPLPAVLVVHPPGLGLQQPPHPGLLPPYMPPMGHAQQERPPSRQVLGWSVGN